MNLLKRLSRLLLLRYPIIAFIILAGCSSGPQKNQKPAEDSLSKPDPGKMKNFIIGMSTKTLSAPYFVAQLKTVQRKTEELGMKFVYADAQDDINKQIATVEDLIAQGINVLIINPLDPKALIQAQNLLLRQASR